MLFNFVSVRATQLYVLEVELNYVFCTNLNSPHIVDGKMVTDKCYSVKDKRYLVKLERWYLLRY
jgi:hypothetical protein